MFPLVYTSYFKIFLAIGLAVWLVMMLRCKRLSAVSYGVSAIIFWLMRLIYSLDTPPQEMDMSTWIASAKTIAQLPEPLWHLLNYTDGRPLTVLPLVKLKMLGFSLSFRAVEMFGASLWVVIFLILRKLCDAKTHLLLVATMFWLGSVWSSSLIDYNSEIVCSMLMVVGIFLLQKISFESNLQLFVAGLWLGFFPFAKFQTVPMGLVLGTAFVYELWKSKGYASIFYLFLGAILPTLLVVAHYYSKNHLDYFWGDYFGNYFLYSYSDEFSKTSHYYRFSPQNLFIFLTRAKQSAGFWLVFVVGAFVSVFWRRFTSLPNPLSFQEMGSNERILPSPKRSGGEAAAELFWLATLYAVLQAGNHFEHYLLLLIVPSLWLFDRTIGQNKILFFAIFFGISLQTLANVYGRYKLPPARNPELISSIVQKIKTLTKPTEKVVLWGYTDEILVLADRPMGYRSPYTFWVFFPSSQQPYRIQQFVNDLEENRPTLFVDAYTPRLDHFPKSGHWRNIPAVKSYIDAHYQQVSSLDDVVFYRRNP